LGFLGSTKNPRRAGSGSCGSDPAKSARGQTRKEAEAGLVAEGNRKADGAQLAAQSIQEPAQPNPPPSPPVALKSNAAADPTGLYGGQICYGSSEGEPARCVKAQAAVLHNKISGQWPAHDPGATMYLVGEVFPSGDVAIHMHAERADGSRFAIIDLVGKLRDERIEASGGFRNGRSVTLDWRKNCAAAELSLTG
jgi:hypothetical protein